MPGKVKMMQSSSVKSSIQRTMNAYILKSNNALNRPAELLEGNIVSLIEQIKEGETLKTKIS